MAVDLNALAKIAEGDPSSKVTVTRRWLREVHRLLSEAEKKTAKPASDHPWLQDIFGARR